ncbi:MAG: hypothetical protein MRERC_2c105 [Mycoplasmataceae bacterium RC_NB112A]|nr:MAG: hypothetical protein MRERC_2c105 [Mycoplasmataceae bacterium RC_NB112A]
MIINFAKTLPIIFTYQIKTYYFLSETSRFSALKNCSKSFEKVLSVSMPRID